MNYRQLGKTGLTVSEIGFGCGNVGGLMIRGNHDEQVEAVKHALELGINYFDTAPVYGDGQSETNLGKVLDELNPKIILATKVRIGRDDLQDIKSAVQRSLDTSLKRLASLGLVNRPLSLSNFPYLLARLSISWSEPPQFERPLSKNPSDTSYP